MNAKIIAEIWLMHSGKIVGMVLGFIIGILILAMGFFKTLFVALCTVIGYVLGRYVDSNEYPKEDIENNIQSIKENIMKFLEKLLPPSYYR